LGITPVGTNAGGRFPWTHCHNSDLGIASLEESKHRNNSKAPLGVLQSLDGVSGGSGFCVLSAGRDRRGKAAVLTTCPTESKRFKHFNKGLVKRMGQDVRSQLGLSIQVMLALMESLETNWLEARPGPHKDNLFGTAAYSQSSLGRAL
jgi:hypothetical protein